MKKKIHFGWFAGEYHGPRGWDEAYSPIGYDWREAEMWQKMAQICEKGMFDFALFADRLGISSVYQESIGTYVKYGLDGLCHDATMISAMVAAATTNIGVGTTVSTTLTPPYILARQVASLDHLTKGRVAWNVVTTADDAGYLNRGVDLVEHDSRYDIADEYMDLCFQLWDSWEPDAVIMDKKTGIFADPSKVHPINFEGEHYKSRGPLNVAPSPQGRPTIIQAGASERGREFASRWADAVIVNKRSVKEMKVYYDDLKGRVIKHGRNPDSLKIFFNITPIVGETEEIANLKKQSSEAPREVAIQTALAALSSRVGIDFAQFNLDEPLPERDADSFRGGITTLYKYNPLRSHKTLRQIAMESHAGSGLLILGNPEQVANQLQEIIEFVGGDGFTISVNGHQHAYMLEFVNTVIPILQERDLVRKEYTGRTLRENVLEF